MKIQPIIKHQPADEWMKREPKPVDKMCKEHNPLMGLGSGDDLSWPGVDERSLCPDIRPPGAP